MICWDYSIRNTYAEGKYSSCDNIFEVLSERIKIMNPQILQIILSGEIKLFNEGKIISPQNSLVPSGFANNFQVVVRTN